jgi:hypothetical protein
MQAEGSNRKVISRGSRDVTTTGTPATTGISSKKQTIPSVFRIWIGSGFNQVCGSVSGSTRAKMTRKSRKN